MRVGKRVYLAGPITGLSYAGATEWRDRVWSDLAQHGIEAYSPMRLKKALSHIQSLSADTGQYAHLSPFATARAIMTRDHNDVIRADAVLVNFIGATQVSPGTVMEIAWAFTRQIPVVLAVDDSSNVHKHMMIDEAIGFRCPTLEDAVEVVKGILLP